VVGFLAVVWLLFSYRLVSDAKGLLDDRGHQIEITINLMAATFPIVVGAFIAAARPPNRRLYLRRAVKPLGALVALPCSIVFVIVAIPWSGRAGVGLEPLSAGAWAWFAETVFIWLWALPFTFFGMFMSVVHGFRTADIHEMVPPLLVTLLVCELAVYDLIVGTYDGVPFWVRVALTFGAPLSVIAMTMWELRRLRTRHGITLRRALLR
jgi:hypothetical protein